MSSEQPSRDLEARVARLEQRVAELEAARAEPVRTAAIAWKPPPAGAAPVASAPPSTPLEPTPPQTDRWFEMGEGWLGRAGVGLLAIGLVFLFRYAVDQGWLTPTMRIAIGIVIGAGLLVAGLRFFPERRRYRQILMGGGISVLFLTGLAASEWYHLISGMGALAFNTLIGAIAFVLAARQDDEVLASIGAAGSLLPPGFLFADAVPGTVLWLHVTLIIVWTGLLYATRGWPGLLKVAALSGVAATLHDLPGGIGVRVSALGAFAAAWLSYAVLPLVRSALPARTASPTFGPLDYFLPSAVALGLALSAEVLAFRDGSAFEIATMIAALGFIATASWAGPARIAEFSASLFAAAILATAAVATIIETPWNILGVAVIAALSLHFGRQNTETVVLGTRAIRPLVVFAHAVNIWLGLALFASYERLVQEPPFDQWALAFIGVVACAAYTTRLLHEREQKLVYFGGIFVAVHMLLAAELGHVEGASWLASVSWGVVGGALMVYGLSRDQRTIQRAGLVSLALVIGRLFTVDLANVGVGVRIILFIGFGFVFLALSYLFRARKVQA